MNICAKIATAAIRDRKDLPNELNINDFGNTNNIQIEESIKENIISTMKTAWNTSHVCGIVYEWILKKQFGCHFRSDLYALFECENLMDSHKIPQVIFLSTNKSLYKLHIFL